MEMEGLKIQPGDILTNNHGRKHTRKMMQFNHVFETHNFGMAMDDETLTLVLEFLLRQPIPNPTLSTLISSLPPPGTLSRRLHHSILLRHLTFFPYSDETLTTLELLHQFHNNSVSLQTAYSAVAVYLTVRLLQKEDVVGFVKEVESLWRKRIGDLEKGEERGLVAKGLRRERRTMEMALGSEIVREELQRRDISGMAEEAVGVFLKEALEGLGLTGLELAAEVVRLREASVKGRNDVLVPAAHTEAFDGGECSISGFSQQPVPNPIQKESQLKQGHEKNPVMTKKSLPGIEIEKTIEGEEENHTQVGIEHAPHLNDGQNTTNTSDGHNEKNPVMTKEPLPEIETEKTIEGEEENLTQVGIEHAPDLNGGPNATNTSDGHNKIHNDVPQPNAMERETNQTPSCKKRLYSPEKGKKPSIIERNPTARTHQWHEDSLSPSLEEKSPIPRKKRIPATIDISVGGGAVGKEQTPDEEDTLRKAVSEALILMSRGFEPNDDPNTTNTSDGHNEKNPVMTKEPLPEIETEKTIEGEEENHTQLGIEHAPDLNGGPNTTNTIDGHNKIRNDVSQPNAMERETNQTPSCRKRLNSPEKGKKPSIMERNPTARTHQWHEDSPSPSLEEKSPIPRRSRRIPATIDISFGGAVRKEWTPDEEDTLRKAVSELSTGNWKLIQSRYPEFQGRTLEGLRNKWRHMNRKLGSKKTEEGLV